MSLINSFAKVDFQYQGGIHDIGNTLTRPGIRFWGGRRVANCSYKVIPPSKRKNFINTVIKTVCYAITTFLGVCFKALAYVLSKNIRIAYQKKLFPHLKYNQWISKPAHNRPQLLTNDNDIDTVYFERICRDISKGRLDYDSHKPLLSNVIIRNPAEIAQFSQQLHSKFTWDQLGWIVETFATSTSWSNTNRLLNQLRIDRNLRFHDPEMVCLFVRICEKMDEKEAVKLVNAYFQNSRYLMGKRDIKNFISHFIAELEKQNVDLKKYFSIFEWMPCFITELGNRHPDALKSFINNTQLSVAHAEGALGLHDRSLRAKVMNKVKDNLPVWRQPARVDFIGIHFMLHYYFSSQVNRNAMIPLAYPERFSREIKNFKIKDSFHQNVLKTFINDLPLTMFDKMIISLHSNDFIKSIMKIASVTDSEEKLEYIVLEALIPQRVSIIHQFNRYIDEFQPVVFWKVLQRLKGKNPVEWGKLMAITACESLGLGIRDDEYLAFKKVLETLKQHTGVDYLASLPDEVVQEINMRPEVEILKDAINSIPNKKMLQWLILMLKEETPEIQSSLSQLIIDASAAHYIQTGVNPLEGCPILDNDEFQLAVKNGKYS